MAMQRIQHQLTQRLLFLLLLHLLLLLLRRRQRQRLPPLHLLHLLLHVLRGCLLWHVRLQDGQALIEPC
jgi:hypothetical protein